MTAPPEVDAAPGRRFRTLSGPLRACELVLLAAIPVLGILFLSDVSAYVDYAPWREQYVALVFGTGLAALYLTVPARPGRIQARVPLYDLAFGAAGLAIGIYTAVRWPSFGMSHFYPPVDVPVALLTIALVLEATRRAISNVLFGLALATIAFALTAEMIPGRLSGRSVPWDDLAVYLYTDASGIIGLPLGVASTVVLAFILFGTVLFMSGGGQVFIDLALSLVGRKRGGPAKAAVVASALFGSISGSAVSNAVMTGSLTIPLMIRTGYAPRVAAGIEAVASTGGQLLPPVMGAAAFLMADFLAIPYAEVALAALVPAVLFYICLFVQVHLEAVKGGARTLPEERVPALADALKRSWLLIVPLVVLIYILFVLNWHATKAGLVAAGIAFACGVLAQRGHLRARTILVLLEETGRRMLDLLVITAVAGIVIGTLAVSGASFNLALQAIEIAGGNLFVLLILTAVTGIVLGMGMPTAGVYILLAVLAAPALIQLGVDRMAAHLFVLYFGMLSMITPPVCLAVFATTAISGSDNMRTGLTAMRLGGASYLIPFVFALSPVVILQAGSVFDICRALATATVGVATLGAVFVGYLFRPLGVVERIVLGAGCLLLIWPDLTGAGPGLHHFTDLLGGIVVLAQAIYLRWTARRRARPDASAGRRPTSPP